MPAAAAAAAVFLGIDVGKTAHYGVAIDWRGAVVRQWRIGNDEPSLQRAVRWAKQRNAAVIVDQLGGLATLLLRLCWDHQVPAAYLHGSAMAHARDFYAGEGKSDPKDAFVLADVARAHPNRVAWLEPTPEAHAELALLCSFDEDLTADINRLTNRLRMLLATYSPDLERAFGERVASRASLGLLQRYPSREALIQAGTQRVTAVLKGLGAMEAAVFAQHLLTAARAQTVTLSGAARAEQLVRELAQQLSRALLQREALEKDIAALFFGRPEATILVSLPGIGARLGARILNEIGNVRRFPSAAHLASYAGLGPASWRSGTSLHHDSVRHLGNQRLKNALFQAAFASLPHKPSRAYYDRKRQEGKSHRQATLCLARRRLDVLFAMLTRGEPYRAPQPEARPEAA
jgi:transposase